MCAGAGGCLGAGALPTSGRSLGGLAYRGDRSPRRTSAPAARGCCWGSSRVSFETRHFSGMGAEARPPEEGPRGWALKLSPGAPAGAWSRREKRRGRGRRGRGARRRSEARMGRRDRRGIREPAGTCVRHPPCARSREAQPSGVPPPSWRARARRAEQERRALGATCRRRGGGCRDRPAQAPGPETLK